MGAVDKMATNPYYANFVPRQSASVSYVVIKWWSSWTEREKCEGSGNAS